MVSSRVRLFLTVLILISVNLTAEDKDRNHCNTDTLQLKKPSFWLYYVKSKINLSQSAYSNWKKGGENQIAWLIELEHSVKKEVFSIIFENKGKLSYGRTKIAKEKSRKSADQIEIETIFSGKRKFFSSFFSIKAETQFDQGFDVKDGEEVVVSDFADPLYLTESLGLNFNFNKRFQTRIGISAKEIFTDKYPFWSDNPNTPNKKENFKFQQGLESVSQLNINIMDNLDFKSKIIIFSELKKFKNTDVNFYGNLTSKINKYLTFDFKYTTIYDRDVSAKRQIFEILAVGFSLNIL